LAFRHKYGVIGGGAVGASLIGKLPARSRDIGPVLGTSYRVASRIANSLRAGYAVRSAVELQDATVLLLHAPPEQILVFVAMLEEAAVGWSGRCLIFCDCVVDREVRLRLEAKGLLIAVLREFGIPGRMVAEGDKGRAAAAMRAAHGLIRQLQVKSVEIPPDCSDLFDAAVMLSRGANTVLIDYAADLMREAGIRETEAARLGSLLFEQTARDYAHSGRQSWAWHIQRPDAERLRAQLTAAGPELEALLRQLLTASFERFRKHSDIGLEISAK
jgi:hypothetical protein